MDRTGQLLLDLVELVYEVATDCAKWPAFLERFAASISGTSTVLHVDDLSSLRGSVQIAVRSDPAMERDYEYYSSRNLWIQRSQHLLTPGNVVTSEMACSRGDLERSEYYNDFLRRYDIFHSFAAVVVREHETVSLLTSCRPASTGPFGEDEMTLIRALSPHVARALRIQRQLQCADGAIATSADVIDRLAHGVFFLDACGRIILTNRAGDEILRSRDGLFVDDGGLRASQATDTAALRRTISTVVSTARRQGVEAASSVVINRPSGRRPMSILIAPAVRRRFCGAETATVLMLVTDPERFPPPSENDIGAMLGLTSAEARLARALLDGLRVEQVADRLGLRVTTVRTRLKTIFEKTGTHSQSDLIRLLMTSCPTLR